LLSFTLSKKELAIEAKGNEYIMSQKKANGNILKFKYWQRRCEPSELKLVIKLEQKTLKRKFNKLVKNSHPCVSYSDCNTQTRI